MRTGSGETFAYDTLISTLPLNNLLALAGEWPAPDLFEAAEILNVRVGFRGAVRIPHQWVYVADAEIPFHRIGFPGNVNGRTCPPGCASISVEYTYPACGPAPLGEAIAASALDYLDEPGLVELDEVLTVTERLLTPAYVVHRSPGRPELEAVRELLAAKDVVLAGRFGAWDYLSIEESFESGWRAGVGDPGDGPCLGSAVWSPMTPWRSGWPSLTAVVIAAVGAAIVRAATRRAGILDEPDPIVPAHTTSVSTLGGIAVGLGLPRRGSRRRPRRRDPARVGRRRGRSSSRSGSSTTCSSCRSARSSASSARRPRRSSRSARGWR